MASSTEDSVRAVIVGAVEAIGADLGFDRANGNVVPYLLEEEIAEKRTSYLMAPIGASQRVRAWGVQVYGQEDWTGAHAAEYGKRVYTIVLDGYYGAHGETPINTALTHARKVRQAVHGLHLHLSNTVDWLLSLSEPQRDRLEFSDIPVEVFRLRMIGIAEKKAPQW